MVQSNTNDTIINHKSSGGNSISVWYIAKKGAVDSLWIELHIVRFLELVHGNSQKLLLYYSTEPYLAFVSFSFSSYLQNLILLPSSLLGAIQKWEVGNFVALLSHVTICHNISRELTYFHLNLKIVAQIYFCAP